MLNLINRANPLKKEKKDSLVPIYTALLSTILCMVCLAGTTWAWFTANQGLPVAPITSAEWTLDTIQVYKVVPDNVLAAQNDNVQSSQTPVEVTIKDNIAEFSVDANAEYVVNATMKGSASQGFLKIDTGDGSYYDANSQSSFTLRLSQKSSVEISASWGSLPDGVVSIDCGALIGNGEIFICNCTIKCVELNETCPVCKNNIGSCVSVASNNVASENDEAESASFADENKPAQTLAPIERPFFTETNSPTEVVEPPKSPVSEETSEPTDEKTPEEEAEPPESPVSAGTSESADEALEEITPPESSVSTEITKSVKIEPSITDIPKTESLETAESSAANEERKE